MRHSVIKVRHSVVKQCIAAAFSVTMQICLMSQAYAWGVFDTSFPYKDSDYIANPTTDVGKVLKQSNQWWSLLENLLDLFGINYAGPNKPLVYVQVIINYVLSILWFIALLLILYSFYMIFFGKSDDAIANARKTVKGAAIALFVIWLSAYIVNFLFYLYARGI